MGKNCLAEAVLTCTHNLYFEKNKKNIKQFLMKIFNFYNIRKICILHGYVFVMKFRKVHNFNDFNLTMMKSMEHN